MSSNKFVSFKKETMIFKKSISSGISIGQQSICFQLNAFCVDKNKNNSIGHLNWSRFRFSTTTHSSYRSLKKPYCKWYFFTWKKFWESIAMPLKSRSKLLTTSWPNSTIPIWIISKMHIQGSAKSTRMLLW